MMTSKPTEEQSSPGWGDQLKPCGNGYTYTLWCGCRAHDFCHTGLDRHISTCGPLPLFVLWPYWMWQQAAPNLPHQAAGTVISSLSISKP